MTPAGGLRPRAGAQRLYEEQLALRLPAALSSLADVAACYRIRVEVHNPLLGRLFGYEGTFRATWHPGALADIPAHARPRRYESRE